MIDNLRMSFAFPAHQAVWWGGAAVLVLGAIFVALRRFDVRRRARMQAFVDAGLAPRLLGGFDARAYRPLSWLTLLGCAALALTFAQPHWGEAWQETFQQSRDVVVCLDTSESMRASNPMPNRLERAKQKIVSLLGRAAADRFALVAFSGAAQLQSPLTTDHGYFKAVLSAVDTDTISIEGTDIADALNEAAKVFKEEDEKAGGVRSDSRAIVLFSDGEQVSGDAIEAAEDAGQYARIYVIGIGDPNGAEIELPDWMQRYMQGAPKTHLSKLDEETLTKVALAGNGAYTRTTPDDSDIEQVHGLIRTLSTRESGSDVRLHLINRFQWPLALAIVCFAGEGVWLTVLPWWRRRRMRTEGTLHV